ncbi:hypothetical protein [uncultured Vibrio sp.]|uniref:hypothetical protein n=1 Tax=uncultured Vibrio sp. TaxID=114054 RepID=UPI0025E250D6|nr:hypothetical protein [uncultured Vibrio sp.]
MNGHNLRLTLRWIHIVAALFVGASLYSPLKNNDLFMATTLYFLVPIVAITGVAMWKQGKLIKLLKGRRALA